jgi:hypothetical protein
MAGFDDFIRADTFYFAGASLIHPSLLPTQRELAAMAWWVVAHTVQTHSLGDSSCLS